MSDCFRSEKEPPLSIYNPSTWWKIQWARAEIASFLNTRPGEIVRIGGVEPSITLTCTEEVCVLRAILSLMKKVSCISRAGCSSGKFNAEKLCQSSSISGPSETLNPIFENISMISFLTIEIGWREPTAKFSAGRERSIFALVSSDCPATSFRRFILFKDFVFSSLSFFPKSFFCSLGTSLNWANSWVTSPFFPSIRIRNCSISSGALLLKDSTSSNKSSTFSIILENKSNQLNVYIINDQP